jgi:hypothetical protein
VPGGAEWALIVAWAAEAWTGQVHHRSSPFSFFSVEAARASMLSQVSEAYHLAADRLQEEEYQGHPSYHDPEVEVG